MDITHPLIETYLNDLAHHQHPFEDSILRAMEDKAEKEKFPIIGPLVGRLLHQLTLISKPKRILELGSGFGYSALWFAKAMGQDGRIICTDISAENRASAYQYLDRAGVGEKVDFRVGNALEIVDHLGGEFDIIFNDIDKYYYPQVAEKAVSRLRKGGLLISDNTLWGGRVIGGGNEPSTRGVKEFNQLIFSNPSLISSIIPLRDGVSLSIKIR